MSDASTSSSSVEAEEVLTSAARDLRIGAVFITLVASALGIVVPMVWKQSKTKVRSLIWVWKS
jgi:hypothetical protein